MTATYPPVMRANETDVDDFPDHANVLAIVATYQEQYDAMPWPLLVDVVASLPSIGSRLALSKQSVQVDAVLMDIVTDLHARGFLEMTASGAISTARGDEYIRQWNGKFSTRKDWARKDLAELRFQKFQGR